MRELDPVALEAACKAHAPMWEGIDPTIQKYAREQMAAAIQAYLQHAFAELQGGAKPQVGGNPSHLSVGVSDAMIGKALEAWDSLSGYSKIERMRAALAAADSEAAL